MTQAIDVQSADTISTHFARQYPASDLSCRQARRDVATVLAELGLSVEGAYDASVVFNELFTNALLHHPVEADECVRVGIQGAEDGQEWVGIAVTDSGRGALKPAKDVAPERADFGHGLEVVRGLGARLTDVRIPGGYTVTAWVPALDALRLRVCQCDCASVHGSEPSACSWLIEDWEQLDEARRAEDPLAHLCISCRALLLKAIEEADEARRAGEIPR
ncbi:MAG TPA: ATP-binding protein [Actinospica sp.]|nr:ATP-binding protein [Actinospica sp.]